MKAIVGLLVVVVTGAAAQQLAGTMPATPAPATSAIEQDDPGQVLYKKGYAAVLAKKWEEARQQFAELVKSYPKSKYVDAAQYWTAYSVAQTNQKKAAELYRQFLEQYRTSEYFDDAVADFEKLTHADAPVLSPVPLIPPPPPVDVSPEIARAAAAELAHRPKSVGVAIAAPQKEIDPAVQLKMDAIRALGGNPDDAQAYETVKAVALDTKQPTELREAALQTISRFKGHDPVAIYLQVAASGDVRLRQSAIYGIGNTADKGDERAVTALWSYARDGRQPREIREASLVALSRIDQGSMLEQLGAIARTDSDQAIRVHAVYMIGRAGRGKEVQAVEILKSIALDETQPRDLREAAVQTLSLLKSDESLALLKGLATGTQDKKLRLSALYALSHYQADASADVDQILQGVASNRREDSEMRIAALYALRGADNAGSQEFYMLLALGDDDEKIRQAALHLLIQTSEDKGALLETMIGVFEKGGDEHRELRETALYGIASVGNDRAVSYLATVAKTHPEYELRRRAVYYLGSIGGDKAKAALLDIVKQN